MSGVIIFPCLLLACNVKSVSLKLGKGAWIMIMTFCFLIVINFFIFLKPKIIVIKLNLKVETVLSFRKKHL